MSSLCSSCRPGIVALRLAALCRHAKGSGPAGEAISKETVKLGTSRRAVGALMGARMAHPVERRAWLDRLPAAEDPAMNSKNNQRLYAMSVASVYRLYLEKVERKGRTKAEVDEVIRWLTGHSQESLDRELANKTTFETFFAEAHLNPDRSLITGSVCGVRLEEIEEPLMKEIRYLDKLVDELAKGRPMAKILRQRPAA
jgi:hypothetical protein